jgi:hypothetical protein
MSEQQPRDLLVWGWVRLDRRGELTDYECPECGEPIEDGDSLWIAILSDGQACQPVCAGCATSE